LDGGLRRFDSFPRLFGGFFARFGEFSRAFQHGFGEAHLLFRGLGMRGGFFCVRVESLRRSSQLRALLF
jgi:hypothetical protein